MSRIITNNYGSQCPLDQLGDIVQHESQLDDIIKIIQTWEDRGELELLLEPVVDWRELSIPQEYINEIDLSEADDAPGDANYTYKDPDAIVFLKIDDDSITIVHAECTSLLMAAGNTKCKLRSTYPGCPGIFLFGQTFALLV